MIHASTTARASASTARTVESHRVVQRIRHTSGSAITANEARTDSTVMAPGRPGGASRNPATSAVTTGVTVSTVTTISRSVGSHAQAAMRGQEIPRVLPTGVATAMSPQVPAERRQSNQVTQTLPVPAGLPDDLISASEHRRRECKPKNVGGLHVDNQLERLRLLDGKVTGLDAFQDLVDIPGSPPEQVEIVRRIGDEGPLLREVVRIEDRRKPVLEDQAHELLGMNVEDRILMSEDQPLRVRLGHGSECALEFFRSPHLESFDVDTNGPRRVPRSGQSRTGGAIGWVRENGHPGDSGYGFFEQSEPLATQLA